jgi:4a-hydroxytetrahydrobiopterin dehydratase
MLIYNLLKGESISVLINEKCTACRSDSPHVTETDIQELKPQVPDWTLVERETIPRLERVFRFKNFVEALSFTNRVGALAEAEGHHPAILTEWGRVTVTLWTHKIGDLHRNDFVMAAKIDSLAPAS